MIISSEYQIDKTAALLGRHLLLLDEREGKILGLVGLRCTDCGERYFAASSNCTKCCSDRLEPVNLGTQGVLWSWTIQSFLPKAPYASGEDPESFRPYGVGYVEMPCGVKVESRLTCAEPGDLVIGMAMKLRLVRFGTRDDGQPLYTYAFAPEGAD